MAVTPPTAPTPPTPPSVPKVSLEGGGSVTQSTVPQNKNQTDAQRQEADARQAVAQGDGPLSKTTQEKPNAKQNQQGQSEGQQSQTTVVQTDPQAAAAMQDGKPGQEGQNTQTAQAVPPPPSFTGHGTGYWIFTFVSVFVLAFVLFRVVLKKRDGRKGELSAADIRQAIEPEESESSLNLRGLTPDEALRQLEEQEAFDAAEEVRKARAEAKARLTKARSRVQLTPEVPASAAPKQIARQYREQVTAMPPEIKAKPKKIVRKPPKDEADKEHFEISV
ncbi:MAG: hypothetical protein K6F01_11830 [Selenomonas sp.]|uniref:hypothetical protein n=1 Tax=Selenomonas sp. TaxID=2053611 RepID=UPI0025D56837|nr:hypothetical protein [Selenomonas sp.]MCR5440102.1 hypothetical protein [Selenomonas sp.]